MDLLGFFRTNKTNNNQETAADRLKNDEEKERQIFEEERLKKVEVIEKAGGQSKYTTKRFLKKIEEYHHKNHSLRGLSFAGENLSCLDLSKDAIAKELTSKGFSEKKTSPWYSGDLKAKEVTSRPEIIAGSRNAKISEVVNKKGINLEGVDFSKAVLVCANLEGADLQDANFESAKLHGANLRKTRLWGANFRRANLTYADLSGSALQNASFEDASLRGVSLKKCLLYNVHLRNTDIEKDQISEIWEEIRAKENKKKDNVEKKQENQNETKKKSDEDELRRRRYRDAKIAYNKIKNNFADIGKYDDAGWAFTKEKVMERKSLSYRNTKTLWNWILSWLGCISCGYGEKPVRVIWVSIAVILAFALVFSSFGNMSHPDTVNANMTQNYYVDSLIFSAASFSTINFLDITPSDNQTKFLSVLESLMGVFLLALFAYCLGRRMTGY